MYGESILARIEQWKFLCSPVWGSFRTQRTYHGKSLHKCQILQFRSKHGQAEFLQFSNFSKSFFESFEVIKISNSCSWTKTTPRQNFLTILDTAKEMAPRGIEDS